MSCNRFMTIKPRERAMKWFRLFIRRQQPLQPPFYLPRRSRKTNGSCLRQPADYVSASILEVRCQWFTTAQPAKQNPQECPMKKLVPRFLNDHGGATAIEYGLIAASISIAIIAVVNTIGTNSTPHSAAFPAS
jgi:pilus assembly protein Flp/PilA